MKATVLQTAIALVAACAPAAAFAQAAAGSPRRPSPEVEALNPPVPADIVVSEERRGPAEGAEVFDVGKGE